MTRPFLSIVIPAFNEAARIVPTLERVRDHLLGQDYSWEVIVVDDGSTDDTAGQVNRFPRDPRIQGISVAHNGKGWAVRCGMLQARGRYRFLCDADLSMPIDHLDRFLPPILDGYDIALGSREILGAQRIGEPVHRHLMGRGFNLIVRQLLINNLADTQCGFKCFRDSVATDLFSQQRVRGFAFDVELLFLAQLRGYHMVEVPIDWNFNAESKVHPFRDTLTMLRDILAIRWWRWRGQYNHASKSPLDDRTKVT